MTAYSYPDSSEAITDALINATPTGRHGWERSEALVLGLATAEAVTRFGLAARTLDIGAGNGRLSHVFGRVSRSVTALELDPDRFDRTAMQSEAQLLGFELELVIGDARSSDQVSGAPFTLVLCSHLLQHLPHDHCDAVLDAVWRATTPGGLIYLAVPVCESDSDDLVVAHLRGGDRVEDEVTREQFDGMCLDSSSGLPTRKFALGRLLDTLDAKGFEQVATLAYHFSGEPWPTVPIVASISSAQTTGVIDVAILLSR